MRLAGQRQGLRMLKLRDVSPSGASSAFAPEQACARPGQATLARPARRATETKAVNLCAT